MPLPNIFEKEVSDGIIARINNLKPDSPAQWGKMDVSKMLAHCNVAYEMIYTDQHPKPNFLMGFILKTFIKNKVVGEAPFPKNSRTAPQFIITSDKDFEAEKKRLIDYINKTQELGEAHFDGKESHSFGPLTKTEYSNMMYKHLNHHLEQFGA
jgi:hypothetical protein